MFSHCSSGLVSETVYLIDHIIYQTYEPPSINDLFLYYHGHKGSHVGLIQKLNKACTCRNMIEKPRLCHYGRSCSLSSTLQVKMFSRTVASQFITVNFTSSILPTEVTWSSDAYVISHWLRAWPEQSNSCKYFIVIMVIAFESNHMSRLHIVRPNFIFGIKHWLYKALVAEIKGMLSINYPDAFCEII